jgi:hypothetical protein
MPPRLKPADPGPLQLSKALGLAYKCAALRARESADIVTTVHGDRVRVSYDPAAHRMTVLCAATQTLDQWLSNLRAGKETARAFMQRTPGQVHLGFSLRAAEILPHIRNAWESYDHPQIDFAGHSRGGALCTLLAALFCAHESRHIVAEVITFGSPRIGDARFADWYDSALGSRTMRFVHCADMVPYLPTRLRGYANQGSLVYIDRAGRISMDHRSAPLLDRLIAIVKHIGTRGARMVKDHNLSNYIAALENTLAAQP